MFPASIFPHTSLPVDLATYRKTLALSPTLFECLNLFLADKKKRDGDFHGETMLFLHDFSRPSDMYLTHVSRWPHHPITGGIFPESFRQFSLLQHRSRAIIMIIKPYFYMRRLIVIWTSCDGTVLDETAVNLLPDLEGFRSCSPKQRKFDWCIK